MADTREEVEQELANCECDGQDRTDHLLRIIVRLLLDIRERGNDANE